MWNLSDFEHRTALIDETGESLTYGQLYSGAGELAAHIDGRSLVFCLCSNSMGSVLGYAAFLNHRIVPLMLDEHVDRTLLDGFLAVYRPDYLWLPRAQADSHEGRVVYEARGYALVKRPEAHVFPLHEDLALLLTTSGSTGSPKLVRQSYENTRANTVSIVASLDIDASERAITTLPMNYTYGLSIINSHLWAGAALILSPYTVVQREFWTLFSGQQATSFGGVPYTYEMLDKLRFFQRKLPSLRTMTQAGGKLLPELHGKFAEYARREGKRFIVMYGQAEASPRMGYLPADKALEKCGAMGVAIPGGRFRLLDEHDADITAPGVVGELLYEGKNVTLGYAERGEDLAKGDERHGVLHTGDMASFDAEGFFTIVGRKKRFLKIFGNRVGLDETERLLKSHFSCEVACAGKDDAMQVFVTDEGAAAEVKHFLAEKTRLNPSAFHVHVLESIPKSESGKTRYATLEQLYD
ncbi:AMP-binding protein [uncultured Mailhella sp.]|uniref:AMP-binding protein n=1 Tax=uncultured Mailhella sp. TaxID=1981031 RepID=UPI0026179FDB|nr:AMP-binding protein [uncultured Mailhella sp.]